MSRTYILYNPLAGNGTCKQKAEQLALQYADAVLHDITRIKDYSAFLAPLDTADALVLCGGDGTLCRFVNETTWTFCRAKRSQSDLTARPRFRSTAKPCSA